MSDLVERQQRFARGVASLIAYANAQGVAVTLDEAYRPPETAALYARQGRGIATSLHTMRLAVDLNFWTPTETLFTAADYAPFGHWWTAQDPDHRWGGDFHTLPDPRHFSLTYQGIA